MFIQPAKGYIISLALKDKEKGDSRTLPHEDRRWKRTVVGVSSPTVSKSRGCPLSNMGYRYHAL